MNKIVKTITHLSDLHCRNYNRKEEYYEQFKKFLKEQLKIKPDRIIITGDILHNKGIGMSPELIQMVSWFFRECSFISPLIILVGNHDANLSNTDRLDGLSPIINALNIPDIWYFKESGNYNDVYDNNVVYCVWSCLEEQKTPQLKKYKEKYDPDNKKIYITLFHGIVSGAKNDIGYQFSSSFDIINFSDSDLICLGDIHAHQMLELKEDNRTITAIYAGSFLSQNYSESNNKGYVLYRIKDKNNISYEFKKIDNDFGFYIIQLEGFDNLGKEKIEISKKPNLRILWSGKSNEYSSIRQNEIKNYYEQKYNPSSISVIFESTDNNSLMNIKDDKINNISNPEIQRKLILDFLIENGQLDNEELEIEIEDSDDSEVKPLTFDSF